MADVDVEVEIDEEAMTEWMGQQWCQDVLKAKADEIAAIANGMAGSKGKAYQAGVGTNSRGFAHAWVTSGRDNSNGSRDNARNNTLLKAKNSVSL